MEDGALKHQCLLAARATLARKQGGQMGDEVDACWCEHGAWLVPHYQGAVEVQGGMGQGQSRVAKSTDRLGGPGHRKPRLLVARMSLKEQSSLLSTI